MKTTVFWPCISTSKYSHISNKNKKQHTDTHTQTAKSKMFMLQRC